MIDFDLTHLANLLDFPGFDLLLKAAISDSVAAMFVLPEKYVVKLCPDIDLRELRYPLPKVRIKHYLAHVSVSILIKIYIISACFFKNFSNITCKVFRK